MATTGRRQTVRRQTVRRLRTPGVWENIPAGARVAIGDELVFAWLPPGWSAPLTVRGLVVSAGAQRRSWFVAVDSTCEQQGTWHVRMRSDGSLLGEPHTPADEHWWLQNPPSALEPLSRQRTRNGIPAGQLPLFGDDDSSPEGSAWPPRPARRTASSRSRR